MQWTHDATIRDALWIGGGQWAGKTTAAALLGGRYGLTHYHCDYADSRGHEDRRTVVRARLGKPAVDWAAYWTELDPHDMAQVALDMFVERFPWVLDDLRALVSTRPILVDGWNLRPDLVATVADVRRMILMVPTEEWRLHQAAALERAQRINLDLPDPARAQRNRLDRDRILAQNAVDGARSHGVRIVEVDGSRDPESIADEIADHFSAFLAV